MALYDILINLVANTAALESGLKRAEDRIGQFASVVKSSLEFAGVTLGLKALGDSFASAAEQGEQLELLSTRLGTSVEYLSQLQYAAKATNVPFEALTASIDTFSKNLVQGAEGAGRAKAALNDLGINASALLRLPLDTQLGVIADKIAALPNPTQQTAAAMRIFGSAGADLLPILREGSAGIDALRQKADSLGVTLNGETVEALAKTNSAITDLKTVSHTFWLELAGDIAPAASGLEQFLTQTISGFKNLAFGFSSPQAEMANLTNRVLSLKNEINQLNAGQQGKGWLSRNFGLDADQIATDTQALTDLQKRIAIVQAQIDNDLQPVRVTARKRGGNQEDDSDLAEINLSLNGHMTEDYYNKLKLLGETDAKRQADEWTVKLIDAQNYYEHSTETAEDYAQRIKEINDSYLTPVEVTAKQIGKLTKTVYDDMATYAKSAAQSIQSDFATFLEDPSISSFKHMLSAWILTLGKMEAEAASADLFKKLFGENTQTGGLEGIFGGLLGKLFGGGGSGGAAPALQNVDVNAFDFTGFANGGSFNVGGSGGTDSQLVAFKATPGENVQVGGGGQGGDIYQSINVTVTSPQVTKADVVSATKQAADSAVARVIDGQRRGRVR